MQVKYTPTETKTYVSPAEFIATWEEDGGYKYRLKIHLGVFELGQWDSAGLQYTRYIYPYPSVDKVLEAIEKYKDRLDIES